MYTRCVPLARGVVACADDALQGEMLRDSRVLVQSTAAFMTPPPVETSHAPPVQNSAQARAQKHESELHAKATQAQRVKLEEDADEVCAPPHAFGSLLTVLRRTKYHEAYKMVPRTQMLQRPHHPLRRRRCRPGSPRVRRSTRRRCTRR